MEEQRINQSDNEQQTSYSGYGYEGNPFEQMEEDLCKRCHRRKIDRSENSESVLCKDCREELIKLKVPPVITGLGIGIAVLVLVCIAIFATDVMKFKTGQMDFDLSEYMGDSQEEEAESEKAETREQDEGEGQDREHRRLGGPITTEIDEASRAYADLADTGMVVTALDSMLEDLEADPDNVGMAVTLTDVAMKYSYPDYAAYAIDTYLAGESVSDDIYDRITEYIDKLDIYYNTCDIIDEIWTGFTDKAAALDEDAPEDDYLELLQICHDEIEFCVGMDEYDQAYLYYELAYICQDEEERIRHLKDCVAIDANYYDAQAQLGTYYRRQGELEKARGILESAYTVNKESYTVQRSLATLELTEGNLELGLEYAKSAYEIYSEGTYVVDTYVVALAANGQEEEAETILKQWEEEGYIFDDDFYSFLAGSMTLEEYYIGD